MASTTKAVTSKHALGVPELYALSIGQVIGAGVVTVLGSAMLVTGKSVWLAYALAVFLGLLNILPSFISSSVARMNGGGYSMVSGLTNQTIAGIYMLFQIPNAFAFSLFGVSLGMYASSLVPGLNPRLTGIVLTTAFYVINLLNLKSMARVQKAMTWLLIGCLVMFCVFGFSKVGSAPFEFTSPDYFQGGGNGFVRAIILLVYSTTSYSMVVNYSKDAQKPKKNLPKVMWMSFGTILVLYSLIGIVASGVLPIGEVAGKPLTFVAKAILPTPLFLLFIFGGVIMALATTLNSMFGSYAQIYMAGTRDGWFPASFGKLNRFGRPWVLLTIIYIIGVVPIVLGFDVNTITNNIVLITYFSRILSVLPIFLLPKKYPELCKNSKYFVNKPFFYTSMTLSLISIIVVMVLAGSALTPTILIASLSALVFCVIYAVWRSKSGKVHIENVFQMKDDDDE